MSPLIAMEMHTDGSKSAVDDRESPESAAARSTEPAAAGKVQLERRRLHERDERSASRSDR